MSGGTFTLVGATEQPSVLYHLAHQARRLSLEVVNASGKRLGRVTELEYLPRNATSTGFFTLTWDGTYLSRRAREAGAAGPGRPVPARALGREAARRAEKSGARRDLDVAELHDRPAVVRTDASQTARTGAGGQSSRLHVVYLQMGLASLCKPPLLCRGLGILGPSVGGSLDYLEGESHGCGSRWDGALGALIALVVADRRWAPCSAVGGEGDQEIKLSKHDRALLVEQRAGSGDTIDHAGRRRAGRAPSTSVADGLAGDRRRAFGYRDDSLGYLRVAACRSTRPGGCGARRRRRRRRRRGDPAAGPAARGRGRPGALGRSAGLGHAGAEPVHADAVTSAHRSSSPQPDRRRPRDTIGIVDTGIDLLTPELQTAKTDDGQPSARSRLGDATPTR